MTSVNFNTQNANIFQTRQNPEAYAKAYADKNGISIEEAREELKAKYGDPAQNAGNISVFGNQVSENSYYDFTPGNLDISDLNWGEGFNEGMQMPEQGGIKELFQKFMDFLRGGSGPKKEGDPQSHINPATNTVSGPQKEGDYNPTQGPEDGSQKDPDTMAQEYADEHNISLDEAKAKLKELYGEPQEK